MEDRDRGADWTKPVGIPDEHPKVRKNVTQGCLYREMGKYNNKIPPQFLWAAEDKLVDKNTYEELKCQLPDSPRSTFLMVFSPDGKKVASTHGNHNVYVTDLTTGKNIQTLSGHPRTPWCIAFHPSSNQILASGCLAGQVRVWDLHGGSEVWTAESQSVIASLAFHPVDRMLVIATYNELHFWDWSQSKPFAKCSTKSEKEKVRYVSFDRLGNKLITGIANPINTPSQWDRVGVVSTQPTVTTSTTTSTTAPSTTTVATTSSSHSHGRSVAFCDNYLMNQYSQLVRRYIDLSRSRITRTIDRGTDPMDLVDVQRLGGQSELPRQSSMAPTSQSNSNRSVRYRIMRSTCRSYRPPSSRERFRIHSSLLSGLPSRSSSSSNSLVRTTTTTTTTSQSIVFTTIAASSTSSSMHQQFSRLRQCGFGFIARPVCLTFSRENSSNSLSMRSSQPTPSSHSGAVTNPTYTPYSERSIFSTRETNSGETERTRIPLIRPYRIVFDDINHIRASVHTLIRPSSEESGNRNNPEQRINVISPLDRRDRLRSHLLDVEEVEIDRDLSRSFTYVSPFRRLSSDSESTSTTPTNPQRPSPQHWVSYNTNHLPLYPRPVPRFQVRPTFDLNNTSPVRRYRDNTDSETSANTAPTVDVPSSNPTSNSLSPVQLNAGPVPRLQIRPRYLQDQSQLQPSTSSENQGSGLQPNHILRRQFVLSRHSNSPFQPRVPHVVENSRLASTSGLVTTSSLTTASGLATTSRLATTPSLAATSSPSTNSRLASSSSLATTLEHAATSELETTSSLATTLEHAATSELETTSSLATTLEHAATSELETTSSLATTLEHAATSELETTSSLTTTLEYAATSELETTSSFATTSEHAATSELETTSELATTSGLATTSTSSASCRPEIPSCMSSFVASGTSSGTRSTTATSLPAGDAGASTSKATNTAPTTIAGDESFVRGTRELRNRLHFFDHVKLLLRDRIRNSSEHASADSTVNYSNIADESEGESRSTMDSSFEDGNSSNALGPRGLDPMLSSGSRNNDNTNGISFLRGTGPSSNTSTEPTLPLDRMAWNSNAEAVPYPTSPAETLVSGTEAPVLRSGRSSQGRSQQRHDEEYPRNETPETESLRNEPRTSSEMSVRQKIRILSLHIENMQRLCRARIEVVQLQQIRKMWEDLTAQIRSLHTVVQNSRNSTESVAESESRNPMERLARNDNSPVPGTSNAESPSPQSSDENFCNRFKDVIESMVNALLDDDNQSRNPAESSSARLSTVRSRRGSRQQQRNETEEPQPGPSGLNRSSLPNKDYFKLRIYKSLKDILNKNKRRRDGGTGMQNASQRHAARIRFRRNGRHSRDSSLSRETSGLSSDLDSMFHNLETTSSGLERSSDPPEPQPSTSRACQSCGHRKKTGKDTLKQKRRCGDTVPGSESGVSSSKIMKCSVGGRGVTSTSTSATASTSAASTSAASTSAASTSASSTSAASTSAASTSAPSTSAASTSASSTSAASTSAASTSAPSTSAASTSNTLPGTNSTRELLRRIIQRMETMVRFQREAFRRTEELSRNTRSRREASLENSSDDSDSDDTSRRYRSLHMRSLPKSYRVTRKDIVNLSRAVTQLRARRLLDYMVKSLTEFFEENSDSSDSVFDDQIISLYTLLHLSLELTDLLLEQLNATSHDLERAWSLNNVANQSESRNAELLFSDRTRMRRVRERGRGPTRSSVHHSFGPGREEARRMFPNPFLRSIARPRLAPNLTTSRNVGNNPPNPVFCRYRPSTTFSPSYRRSRRATPRMSGALPSGWWDFDDSPRRPSNIPRSREGQSGVILPGRIRNGDNSQIRGVRIWERRNSVDGESEFHRNLRSDSNNNNNPNLSGNGNNGRNSSGNYGAMNSNHNDNSSNGASSGMSGNLQSSNPMSFSAYLNLREQRPMFWIRYGNNNEPNSSSGGESQSRENNFTVPVVHVNDIPVQDVSMLSQPRYRPQSPTPRGPEDLWRWRAWRPRFLHPRYMGPHTFDDQDANDVPENIHYYRTGSNSGLYSLDPVIITDAPMSPHHRIQAWDFTQMKIPDISDREANGVVAECKIHNDASVDVSNDGHLLVTLLPSGRFSVTTMLGVYSLDWNSLGQLLYKTSFEQNAVSVSLSPTNRHLLVGLASRPLVLRDRINMAQIFRLEGARPSPPGGTWQSGRGRLVHMRDLEQTRETNIMSLNCIRWAPGAGQGLVYGTNTGQLKVLR